MHDDVHITDWKFSGQQHGIFTSFRCLKGKIYNLRVLDSFQRVSLWYTYQTPFPMDDTDVGPYDLVPPSPIVASAQMPRSLGQRVPPLPQLVISGTSQSDLSPAATSTQQPESSWPLFLSVSTSAQLERSGSLLSPLATSSQHLERSGTLLLPTATSTQQPENSRSVSPTQTRNLTPFQPSQIVSRQPGRLR